MTITKALIDADVRALTLQNPWAFAITHHGKRVENRTWPAPLSVDTLFIHAGKGWDDDYDREPVLAELVATSAIVAVARLAHCCSGSRFADSVVCGCGGWAAAGQCHWVLGGVHVLAAPVPCSGRLGLWKPTTDVLEAVKEQL